MENSWINTPLFLAVKKWPNSWTNTNIPRISTNNNMFNKEIELSGAGNNNFANVN